MKTMALGEVLLRICGEDNGTGRGSAPITSIFDSVEIGTVNHHCVFVNLLYSISQYVSALKTLSGNVK